MSTKKKSQGKKFAIGALLVFIFFILYLAIDLQNSKKQVAQLKQDLQNNEKEINSLLTGKAEPELSPKATTEPYSFSNFGVESPLFEGKEITVKKYTYKRNVFLKKTLEISGATPKETIYVATSQNIGTIKNAASIGPIFFQPDWEWTNVIDERNMLDDNDGTYRTLTGITMYWKNTGFSGSVLNTKLLFLKNYSPMGVPIFAEISSAGVEDANYARTQNAPSMQQGMRNVEKVANTISNR